MMHICIPTKNRLDKQKTLGLLQGYHREDIHLFVEPQEYEIYKSKYNSNCQVINILKDDQGIAYVRNFILDFSKSNDWDYIWMIDDDITEIRMRTEIKEGKSYHSMKCLKGKEIIDALEECYREFINQHSTKVQYGIPFTRDNHFYPELSYKSPDRVWAIGMLNLILVEELGLRYDSNCSTFDDYDLIAQYLVKGYTNITNYKYGFDNVRFTSGKGGLDKVYADKQKVLKLAEYLRDKYGHDLVDIKWKEGRQIHQPVFKWRMLGKQKDKQVGLEKF